MGLRFRRRIRLAPLVHVNVSLSGLSTSLGRPGATLNTGGQRGSRITIRAPGSGLSYSEQLVRGNGTSAGPRHALVLLAAILLICVLVASALQAQAETVGLRRCRLGAGGS